MPDSVLLVVMDGIGIREETEGNAVAQADTPALDRLFEALPKRAGESEGA
ncbi:MAG: hypothetical protein ABEK12_02250, partial [Candidatus Nanohaloarchaea archaeon]